MALFGSEQSARRRARLKHLLVSGLRLLSVSVVIAALCAFAEMPFPEPHPQQQQTFPFQNTTQDSLRRADSLRTYQARQDSIQRANNPFPNDTTFKRFPGRDSLGMRSDSAFKKIDSTWVVCKDSTARDQQFLNHRDDEPEVSPFLEPPYSLYLDVSSPAYVRDVRLDSTGGLVTVREMVNGVDVKVPVTMPLHDYIRQRFIHERQNNWRSMVYDYQFKRRGDDLAGLLGNITNISIPVPSNPLLSIFGRNVINIRVSGQVDIHAAFRHQGSDQQSQNFLDQSQSAPDFNQDVQIAVNGTIGDKLHINADWNTQRTFEYENQLKINYQGYDDEIVQSVEAGNVSLSNTPSLIGGSQALFGIKAQLQAGPLKLTTLVSQKKGEQKEVTVSGGSSQHPIEIRPQDYSTAYYFVDTVYRGFFETLFQSVIPQLNAKINDDYIVDIDVWETTNQLGGAATADRKQGNAFVNLPPHRENERYLADSLLNADPTKQSAGSFETGWWIRLTPDKYKLNPRAGYIALKDNNLDAQAIAVSYRISNAADGRIIYGDLKTVDTNKVILKLIKPKNLLNNYHPAWELQLKNIYNIGADVKQEGFSLKILYRPPSASATEVVGGENLLQVFGLDRYASDNATPTPDGVFDFIPGLTIDQQRGDIIFPMLRPFDDGVRNYFTGKGKGLLINDSLLFREIYDTSHASLGNLQKNNYVIDVVASVSQQSRISLGAFNIVEGSVTVLLNGSPLTVGEDYTVDYIVGEVQLKSERALAPGANLSIKYEQNDMFQLASKTLLGARGTLDISDDANFGFTIMNLNQSSLSDKVRIGEEPTKNTIMGLDGGFKTNLPLLTDILGFLPLVHAREMSSFDIKGEVAYISPDPNTRKSTIAGDDNASIAYLDDFEGSKRTIPMPITYTAWYEASPPVYTLLPDTTTDSVKTWSKAQLHWYNNASNFEPVNVHDIWQNKQVAQEDQLVTVLYLDYDPTLRGMYNFSPDLNSTLHRGSQDNPGLRRHNWNGVQKYISTTAGDLVSQNIDYLEIWVNARTADHEDLKHGRLFIDLGRISEDVIPNGKLNSEDIIATASNPGGVPTGHVQPGADLGLDMLSDDQERAQYASFMESNRIKNGGTLPPDIDPNDLSGDDYNYVSASSDFSHFNGTEKSYDLNSVAGRYPDTEDLNGNNDVDLVNSYLEYEIPLDSTYVDSMNIERSNTMIVGGNAAKKWYQIRIPLNHPTRLVSPNADGATTTNVLQNVQYIRLWLSGFQQPIVERIAEMDLVGNQWAEETQNDSAMKVTVVNVEDNPGYTSPPGVIREVDHTRPDQVVLGNEQSLDLVFNNLPQGQSRNAVKFSTGQALDVFSYKQMKMFVHGDATMTSTPASHDAEVYLRFGNDKNNYYEYRLPVQPGWFEMTIDFGQLTAVKSARDRDTSIKVDSLFQSGPYGIRGRPALTQLLYLAVGVENPRPPNGKVFLSGEVWVNELRVIDADNSSGYAYHFDSQLKLSDIGTISFNLTQRDPNFHLLEERFGTRTTQQSWAVSTNVDLAKYFPQEMQGTQLGMSYSHQENVEKPKYLPGTDVLVTAAAAAADADAVQKGRSLSGRTSPGDSVTTVSQTLNTSDSYSLGTMHFVLPWKPWYINETFNKLSYSFNYTKSSGRSPTVASIRSWGWNFGMHYANAVTGDLSFSPFKSLFNGVFLLDGYKDWKIYFMPVTTFSAGIDANRSASFTDNRAAGVVPQQSRVFNANKSFGFGWRATEGGLLNLGGDYGLSISRDLLFLDNDTVGRGFSSILHSIFMGGRDGGYSQRVTLNTKPKLPNLFDIPKYIDLTTGYNVSYDWRNIFQQNDLGKSVRWSNTINFTSTLRLKSLTDPWFGGSSQQQTPDVPAQALRPSPPNDTGKTVKKDTTQAHKPGQSIFVPIKQAARYLIKIPFLDYESISITFQQQNGAASSGVIGSTGFLNFWGKPPFSGFDPRNGPSRLYQLGLVSDPSADVKFAPSGKFPFIDFRTTPGLRAASGSLTDQFNQQNSLGLRTTRPLWEGATLEINWKVGWQYSKTTQLTTDSLGFPTISSIQTSGQIERSYLALPPFFFLKFLGSGLENVGKKYDSYVNDRSQTAALSDAFEQGMEALPFLDKLFGGYMPRANWSMHWDGLQRISFLGNIFKSLSLDHAYTSTFSKTFRSDPTDPSGTRTDVERVAYGFAPLIGLNGTPKDLFGGNISGSLKYGATTTYDLNLSSQNITETGTKSISFSLSYGSHGFSLPLFGVNLTNDVDITFTYSLDKNSRKLFDPALLSSNSDGTPLEGTTRTTMEPRIRYTLSQRVSASLFYQYAKTAPDEGGSTIFGTTTNAAGVDIHIAIQ